MTAQDVKGISNSIFDSLKNVDVDNKGIKYKGILLINPKTNKTYNSEEIISELFEFIDYEKINSISNEDLENIVKLFLELQMYITKLYFTYNK